jgi:hypothetical protein
MNYKQRTANTSLALLLLCGVKSRGGSFANFQFVLLRQ